MEHELRPDLVVRSRRVVLPGGIRPAALHLRAGTIAGVMPFDDVPEGCPVDDAGDAAVMPGVVDTHVHINEPGRTEWEGFETATRAAAAGGVTTLIEMPLNSIPATTTAAAFEMKVRAAEGRCAVDVGFWGGVIPGNTSELASLFAAGVFGFKCFLVASGVDEFPAVGEHDLHAAAPILATLNAPLLYHAELPGPIDAAVDQLRGRGSNPREYATYLSSRPKDAEHQAIALAMALCREHRVRTHVVHLSSHEGLTLLNEARAAGLSVTSETCPHYLTFVAEEIADGATAFKCAPPIRERENREHLWTALSDGLIQMVVTDHSPAPPAMKHLDSGDFFRAWGGISSLQLGLAVTWTGACARGYTLNQLSEWMCLAPARLAGLARKGSIDVGFDADLVILHPEKEFVVEGASLLHRHPLTPYEQVKLRGVVERTYLRGQLVYERGAPIAHARGQVLFRG